jgi:acetyl-CoA acetyltransferase/uncharacterized OB-fold protein
MPNRPLPFVTPETTPYWTAGDEGVLRLPQCTVCGVYQHPLMVVCPHGHDEALSYVEVSGLGTIVGFTVNAQAWIPGTDPNYVIALVAVDEDPRVRLLTNMVNLADTVPTVGMRVRVVFEQRDDVWLPMFEPSGEPSTLLDVAEPAASVRPMARSDKFEDKVAITGVGLSQIGRRLMRHPVSLAVEAARAAVADAGLTMDDIDGLSTYPGNLPVRGLTEGGMVPLEEALRLRPTWFNGGFDIPGPSGSVVAAMLAVASGLCRHVLCIRTVWEATAVEQVRKGLIKLDAPTRSGGDQAFSVPYGALSAAHWLAMDASQYFSKYGGDRTVLGRIAVNARRNAGLNPLAIYRDPMTMDDYFNARMITSPFGLYDCDTPCDASTALIVSAIEDAADRPHRPVFVEAIGSQLTERQSWDQGTLTHEPNTFGPARHMWTRTTMTPSDIDLACLYDGFTFNCLSWIEALGFCGLGEAAAYIGDGSTIALDGELPLNPHGGQLSMGRLHGFGFIWEAVTQLRGDAGPRQVADARVAVVSTGGATPGGTLLLRNH